jgi:hypothetical protein
MMNDNPQPCPACAEKRRHTAEEWHYHPQAGKGYTPETGWTCER